MRLAKEIAIADRRANVRNFTRNVYLFVYLSERRADLDEFFCHARENGIGEMRVTCHPDKTAENSRYEYLAATFCLTR
jgi:hypothetical protein